MKGKIDGLQRRIDDLKNKPEFSKNYHVLEVVGWGLGLLHPKKYYAGHIYGCGYRDEDGRGHNYELILEDGSPRGKWIRPLSREEASKIMAASMEDREEVVNSLKPFAEANYERWLEQDAKRKAGKTVSLEDFKT